MGAEDRIFSGLPRTRHTNGGAGPHVTCPSARGGSDLSPGPFYTGRHRGSEGCGLCPAGWRARTSSAPRGCRWGHQAGRPRAARAPGQGGLQLLLLAAQLGAQLLHALLLFGHLLLQLGALAVQPPPQLLQLLAALLLLPQAVCGWQSALGVRAAPLAPPAPTETRRPSARTAASEAQLSAPSTPPPLSRFPVSGSTPLSPRTLDQTPRRSDAVLSWPPGTAPAPARPPSLPAPLLPASPASSWARSLRLLILKSTARDRDEKGSETVSGTVREREGEGPKTPRTERGIGTERDRRDLSAGRTLAASHPT